MTHAPLRPAAALLALLSAACGSDDAHRDGATVPADATSTGTDGIPQGSAEGGAFSRWPFDGIVTPVCRKDAFGKNLSGLAYDARPPAGDGELWAVQNDPPKLYRLSWDGTAFAPVTADAWTTGKLLRYPGGDGSPDTEGMTFTDGSLPEVYVVAERNGDVAEVSRQSILRYDPSSAKGILDATHEWVLTGDLPEAEPNHGIEGIAWIPDTYLVERGFFDQHAQAPYAPTAYPDHGTGIFVVGRDDTGMAYGYVLDHEAGGAIRVATFTTGQSGSVDLAFDGDTGTLWSLCKGDCRGQMSLLEIDADPASPENGRFVLRATVPAPKALAGMDNEGIALAPASPCSEDRRAIFWADDAASGGYAIRRGFISCARFY